MFISRLLGLFKRRSISLFPEQVVTDVCLLFCWLEGQPHDFRVTLFTQMLLSITGPRHKQRVSQIPTSLEIGESSASLGMVYYYYDQ